jgi:hypothetical protein
MNPLVANWLAASLTIPKGGMRNSKANPDPASHRFRSGYGVIPFASGRELREQLIATAGSHDT